ncbi:14090_t:CDS:2 [Dentiscutata heterogama]|uniref:14090_t:CDS:1 n=1 Tax=Dentiscutata heterogama TaxID=1316150 RepID=A0ACA9LTK6_9GLOM|nr:14090_t:CDS:2 [Dentiscutata heterogama]
MFGLKLNTIRKHIDNIFRKKTCHFSRIKLQLELNCKFSEPGYYHGQGFAKLRKGKQLEIGYYNSNTKEDLKDEEVQTNPYEIATEEVLKGENIDKVITKYISYTGTEKSKLCKDLFLRIYEKDDIKQFEEYNNEEFNYNCNSIDTNGKRDIICIFEKGNKQDFNNQIFDIEFNKRTTLEQAKEVTTDLGADRIILYDPATGLYYWRQNWTNEINKYSTTKNINDITDQIMTNIPKSKPGE